MTSTWSVGRISSIEIICELVGPITDIFIQEKYYLACNRALSFLKSFQSGVRMHVIAWPARDELSRVNPLERG